MAAPPQTTCKNLTGTFVLNKSLSDDVDPLLILQGVSWFTRKAIGLATVVLTIKQYADPKDASISHIDITSVASGLSTTQENRALDWTDRYHQDRIFGNVVGRSRFFGRGRLDMVGGGGDEDKKFLQGELLKDGKTPGRFLEETSVQSWAHNQDSGYGWTAEQTWNFEEVNGKRQYTRRVVGRKDGKVQRVRLVYDYKGPVKEAATDDDGDDGLAYGEED